MPALTASTAFHEMHAFSELLKPIKMSADLARQTAGGTNRQMMIMTRVLAVCSSSSAYVSDLASTMIDSLLKMKQPSVMTTTSSQTTVFTMDSNASLQVGSARSRS